MLQTCRDGVSCCTRSTLLQENTSYSLSTVDYSQVLIRVLYNLHTHKQTDSFSFSQEWSGTQ